MSGVNKPSIDQASSKIYVGRLERKESVLFTWHRNALLLSIGHRKLPGGAWDGGGPFFLTKQRCWHEGMTSQQWRTEWPEFKPYTMLFKGVAGCPSSPFTNPILFTDAAWSTVEGELKPSWTSGYTRTRPGNPVASVAQFVVELRELPKLPFKSVIGKIPIKGLPRVLFEALKDFRNLGSEYLNVQFGWKPFVSDLRKMYNLWHDIDKQMAKLVRENGKGIRRRATILDEKSTTMTSQTFHSGKLVNVGGGAGTGGGTTAHSVTREDSTRIWFVGKYQYWIPDVNSSMWTARARAVLFGALPTPEVLYQLMPWSWLIDWFANVGDVISNATPNAVDNLTTTYAYVMRHTKTKWTAKAECISPMYAPGGLIPDYLVPSLGQTFNTFQEKEEKARSGDGNPFGLGFKAGSLTGHQLGILAALGISRSKVSL
jgi:hypothetical protein